ncbi:MAG: uncharacterized protein A8A55_3312, partial [Amphiamblys sp. WSBS2006]
MKNSKKEEGAPQDPHRGGRSGECLAVELASENFRHPRAGRLPVSMSLTGRETRGPRAHVLVATWNTQGMKSKSLELEEAVEFLGPDVLLMQETLERGDLYVKGTELWAGQRKTEQENKELELRSTEAWSSRNSVQSPPTS